MTTAPAVTHFMALPFWPDRASASFCCSTTAWGGGGGGAEDRWTWDEPMESRACPGLAAANVACGGASGLGGTVSCFWQVGH